MNKEELFKNMDEILAEALSYLKVSKGAMYWIFAHLPSKEEKLTLMMWMRECVRTNRRPSQEEIVEKAEEISEAK